MCIRDSDDDDDGVVDDWRMSSQLSPDNDWTLIAESVHACWWCRSITSCIADFRSPASRDELQTDGSELELRLVCDDDRLQCILLVKKKLNKEIFRHSADTLRGRPTRSAQPSSSSCPLTFWYDNWQTEFRRKLAPSLWLFYVLCFSVKSLKEPKVRRIIKRSQNVPKFF